MLQCEHVRESHPPNLQKVLSGLGYDSFNRCKESLQAGVGDAPHAQEPHAASANAHEVPVLAGPQVNHPASVVGLLVHQPVALHHVAGQAVGHAETVHDVVAVLHQLGRLTRKVLPLIDLHPERSSVL